MSQEIQERLDAIKEDCLRLRANVDLCLTTVRTREAEFRNLKSLHRRLGVSFLTKHPGSMSDDRTQKMEDTTAAFIVELEAMAIMVDLLKEYIQLDISRDPFAIPNFRLMMLTFRTTYLNLRLLKQNLPQDLLTELKLTHHLLQAMFEVIDEKHRALNIEAYEKAKGILNHGYRQ